MRALRRLAPWILLLLGGAILSLLLATSGGAVPFAPDNAEREGTQGLVQVLEQQGVQVDIVEGLAALPDDVGAGTTVVLLGTGPLGPEAGSHLLAQTSEADRLVVLLPTPTDPVAEVLDLPVTLHSATGARLTGQCRDPLVREGDEVSNWAVQIDADSGSREVVACFPPTASHNVGGARAGSMLTWPADPGRPETVLVGFPQAFTNASITHDAHAALALRLLGGSDRLLWLSPQPGDAAEAGAASLWQVLPRSMTPAVVLLAVGLLALALWQGRRLGPVVTEPLPAVVHAAQTTLSRGRLYHQAQDRRHTLSALQEGTRRRLAVRLGLPARTDVTTLTRAVAEATGRPIDEVDHLISGTAPGDDQTLLTTARELRSLEEGLHR